MSMSHRQRRALYAHEETLGQRPGRRRKDIPRNELSRLLYESTHRERESHRSQSVVGRERGPVCVPPWPDQDIPLFDEDGRPL